MNLPTFATITNGMYLYRFNIVLNLCLLLGIYQEEGSHF